MTKKRHPVVRNLKTYEEAALIKKNILAEGVMTQEGEIQIRRKSDGRFNVVLRSEVK